MGKKKQKVRWTAVEENFFDGDRSPDANGYESSSSGHDYVKHKSYGPPAHEGGPPRSYRRYGNGWANAPLAPRFERRAAAAAAAAAAAKGGTNGPMTVYYDGEICETEQLPDGFTKIRSKNLDVLFKRDYYAHKIDFSRSNGSSERGDLELNSEEDTERTDDDEDDDDTEEANRSGDDDNVTPIPDEQEEADVSRVNKEEADSESSAAEDTKSNSGCVSSYPYSLNAPPFVPSSQQRPNLFLYSPSSNTMIPCEEIIIPNPVMGPEGPLYPGPSNIYLAFPMENTGGSPTGVDVPTSNGGYITHTFLQGPQPLPPPPQALPYDQYGVPYSAHQQPYQPSGPPIQTSSVPSETFQSSSPSEGGTDPSSAESTTPHSPPDLSAYSPATWTNATAHFDTNGSAMHTHGWVHVNPAPAWYQGQESCMDGGKRSMEAVSRKKMTTTTNTTTVVMTASIDESNAQVNHIPGLNPELRNGITTKRTSKKRRKKRSANAAAAGNGSGDTDADHQHRVSLSSEEPVQLPKRDDGLVVKRILCRNDKPLVKESSVCSSVAASSVSLVSSELCDSKRESESKPEESEETLNESAAVKKDNVPCDDTHRATTIPDETEEGGEAPAPEECSEPTAAQEQTEDVPDQSKKVANSNKKRNRKRQPKNKSGRKSADEAPGAEQVIISPDQEVQVSFCHISETSDLIPPDTPAEGEWETKKRKSRKSRGQRLRTEAVEMDPREADIQIPRVVTPPPQSPEPHAQIEAVEKPVEVKVDDDAAKDKMEAKVEAKAEMEEPMSPRKGANKKKKKRFASQEGTESKPSTRQVLITDGLIDFGDSHSLGMAQVLASRRKSESQLLEDLEKARKGRMEKLFISSIGHGIQFGPLLSGRLGHGSYSPPDRSDEIPLKFRQTDEDEEPESSNAATDGQEQSSNEAKTEELALD